LPQFCPRVDYDLFETLEFQSLPYLYESLITATGGEHPYKYLAKSLDDRRLEEKTQISFPSAHSFLPSTIMRNGNLNAD